MVRHVSLAGAAMGGLSVALEGVGGGERENRHVLEDPVHPDARLLFAYWQFCSAQGGLVIGRDVPTRYLARLLSNLVVYEPVDGMRDFRIRLAGAMVWQRLGRDITGSLFSHHFPAQTFVRRRDDMCEAIHAQRPMMCDVILTRDDHPDLHYEVLNVPVLAADMRTPWILGGVFYFD
jgi:hypothetical protein